jgi:hypothetical protein
MSRRFVNDKSGGSPDLFAAKRPLNSISYAVRRQKSGNKSLNITGSCTMNLSSRMISKDDLHTHIEPAEGMRVLLLPKEDENTSRAEPIGSYALNIHHLLV